jgi:hypothetical protein
MPNYILLEKITVGAAGASSVTFSGIPQTGYTDLVVKTSLRGSANVVDTRIDFNGLTTNQTMRFLRNNSGTAGSFTDTNSFMIYKTQVVTQQVLLVILKYTFLITQVLTTNLIHPTLLQKIMQQQYFNI